MEFVLATVFSSELWGIEDFGFEPCTIAYFAWFVSHERANAVTSEFALSLLV